MVVLNAENCVAGRLASLVAKKLLNGEEIIIVNAEKSMVNGNPKAVQKFFAEKIKRGDPYHGPFYPKKPEGILRRIIRGMLPYHKPRGKAAFKLLKVYRSIPNELKNEKPEILGQAVNKAESKFVYLEDISKKFGG